MSSASVAARGCVVGEAGVGDVAVKVLAHLVFTGDPPDCFTSTATFLSTDGVVIPQPQSCSHRYSSMKHSELDELLRTGTCPSSPDRSHVCPKNVIGTDSKTVDSWWPLTRVDTFGQVTPARSGW